MIKLKLLPALILGGTLVACGGGSSGGGSSSAPSSSAPSSSSASSACGLLGCIEDRLVEIDITPQTLPIKESFELAGPDNRAVDFFSPSYNELLTQNPQTLPNGTEHFDPHPSFYYPTCCLWETDPVTGEITSTLIEDLDHRQYVRDGKMAVSGARFSIGQALPDQIQASDSEDKNAKSKTSNAPYSNSWGELPLNQDYRVSFCLNDAGTAGVGGTGGNLELYVDNNSGGNQDQSLHGASSRLLRIPVTDLTPGNRVVIDVPGTVRQVDADGNTVGNVIQTNSLIGTEQSYLQFRVSSGGYAVISDFIIEYKPAAGGSYETYAACEVDQNFFIQPPAPTIQGVAFSGLPLNMNFALSRNEFFGGVSPQQVPAGETFVPEGLFLAMPNDRTVPFYVATGSAGRTWTTPENTIRFGNSNWTAGRQVVNNVETGVIDLSVPYSITMEIEEIPNITHASNGLEVRIDSTSGADKRLINLGASGLATGTLVINVPGDVTMNGSVVGNVPEHIGTSASYIHFSCPSNSGATCSDVVRNAETGVVTGGIEMSAIVVDYTGEPPSSSSSSESSSSSSSSSVEPPPVVPADESYTWGFNADAYVFVAATLFEGGTYNGTSGDSRIAAGADVQTDGLHYYSTAVGTLRFRFVDESPVWNTNGASFSNNTTLFPAVGQEITGTVRSYIAVPVVAGEAFSLEVDFRQNSDVTAGKVGFVASNNTLLAAKDADLERVGDTLTVSVPAGHSYTHVKIMYGREGATGGGVNYTRIERTYPL